MHELFSDQGVLKLEAEVDEELRKVWEFLEKEEIIRKDEVKDIQEKKREEQRIERENRRKENELKRAKDQER